jgi:hypothetical protein
VIVYKSVTIRVVRSLTSCVINLAARSKVGSRVCQKHNCLGFVLIAAIVTTCFGRAWPSSGHKLTLYKYEKKTINTKPRQLCF